MFASADRSQCLQKNWPHSYSRIPPGSQYCLPGKDVLFFSKQHTEICLATTEASLVIQCHQHCSLGCAFSPFKPLLKDLWRGLPRVTGRELVDEHKCKDGDATPNLRSFHLTWTLSMTDLKN